MVSHYSNVKKSFFMHLNKPVFFLGYFVKFIFVALLGLLLTNQSFDLFVTLAISFVSILLFIFFDSFILSKFSLLISKKNFSLTNSFILSIKNFPVIFLIKIFRFFLFWAPLLIFSSVLFVLLEGLLDYVAGGAISVLSLVLFFVVAMPVLVLSVVYIMASYTFFSFLEVDFVSSRKLNLQKVFYYFFKSFKSSMKTGFVWVLFLVFYFALSLFLASFSFLIWFFGTLNFVLGILIWSVFKLYLFRAFEAISKS
ncbi:MAG: hypothetical protein ACMXX7_00950 [Candidatus Woesearchaeota archaeon]